jgi:hypothetical protein
MNSTKWDTLTTFVKYLGKQGMCVVDETEKVGAGRQGGCEPSLTHERTPRHSQR